MLSVENNNNFTKIVYMDVGSILKTPAALLIGPEETTKFCCFKTNELIDVLEINDVYEPEEESNHRIHVLK